MWKNRIKAEKCWADGLCHLFSVNLNTAVRFWIAQKFLQCLQNDYEKLQRIFYHGIFHI